MTGGDMRVALELQPCCGSRSGVGVYTWELARRMVDGEGLSFCGTIFNFLGRRDNGAALAGLSLPVRECRRIPYPVYRRVWDVLPISYGSLFPEGADLYVFFNYIVPPRVEGRVMTTVYDMTYLRFPETMEARNRRRLEEGMARSAAASDRILTISEFSRREIVELLGVPAERVSVVPCAPSLGGGQADFAACAVKFGLRRPYLLYVGTLEPRKNLTRLLRAFARLKREQGIPHQLVLAGGKGWANGEMEREAAAMEDVVLTGYVPEAEKNALYGNAAAFVFPSLYEGFGIPPLEAMAMGCPVVCSDAASLPEVAGDAAELVKAGDELSIAEGIWHVLSDGDYARLLAERGRRQAERFTWDASAERLRAACRAALEVP